MIPVEQKREVFSSGVEGTASFEISGKDAAHIMTILRDTLYSDKVLAVMREYAANAWDANRMAGRGDVPISITLPTYGDPVLKIKDNGPGLSLDDVFEVYNKYGSSTKRDSNTAVGMLGIGSKSGFAYSDTFTIVSYHGGQQATYVAVIDSSEKGRIDLFDVSPLGEHAKDYTGVEIQIPIKPHDIPEFEKKAKSLFAYFVPQPNINTELPPIPKGKDFPGIGRVTDVENPGDYYRPKGEWLAVMGCVPYKVNLNQLQGLSSSVRNLCGILWFDIGELQVAASREELKYGDATKANLTAKLNELMDKYIEFLLDGVDKLNPWERRLRVKKISELHLAIPSGFKDFTENWVQLDANMKNTFKIKSKDYKNRLRDTYYDINVREGVRLVFRNEKKVLAGYTLQKDDLVIDPVIDEFQARKALREQLTKHHLDGIPMVNISTLPWTRPATQARPVDTARAKAQFLVLDPKNIHSDRKSERWTPVTRVPKADDVYVILDSFQVTGLVDFYETYENDRILLESVGGKMPDVIGYRNTQAHPVDRTKLKGKDYKLWRDDEYVKLLMVQQGVQTAVEAKIWGDIDAYGIDTHLIAKLDQKLGTGHIISKYVERVRQSKLAYNRIDRKFNAVVSRIHMSMKTEESMKTEDAKKDWDAITALYPLLGVHGHRTISFIGGGHSDRWIEYIQMVDSVRSAQQIQQQTNEEKAA